MAAAVDEQPGLARRDDRRAERHAGHRAARAPADPVGERDDAGRPVVALLEPAGDDADDAGMPALARGEDQRRRIAAPLSTARSPAASDARLDLAALAVVAVEPLRQRRAPRRIVGRQQPRAEIGGADPAAGIDPRPQDEAEMIGVERARSMPGHVGERREAGIAAPRASP